jgi:hypothetical protein
VPTGDDALYRGIDVEAPAPVVFRWLCQLRAAPYSYDLIDNLGRRSPRRLTPGLERLELGQRFMTIFRLVEFEPDRHVTLRTRNVVVTYLVEPTGARSSRLLVKLRGLGGRIMPIADLFMMRKQLMTLKRLAERDAGTLPRIDEHSIAVHAPPEAALAAARDVMTGTPSRPALAGARLLGCRELRPAGLPEEVGSTLLGFEVVRSTSSEWALQGRHRFSSYGLTFRAEPDGAGGSRLHAESHAAFPGLAGRLYRGLVIGTRGHVLAVRRLLRAAKRRAERR